jgi:hypothetical protein
MADKRREQTSVTGNDISYLWLLSLLRDDSFEPLIFFWPIHRNTLLKWIVHDKSRNVDDFYLVLSDIFLFLLIL